MNLTITRHNRMRSGSYMTLAIWENYSDPKEDASPRWMRLLKIFIYAKESLKNFSPPSKPNLKPNFSPTKK